MSACRPLAEIDFTAFNEIPMPSCLFEFLELPPGERAPLISEGILQF
jgi:hypothetical protein